MQLFSVPAALLFSISLSQTLASAQLLNTKDLPESPPGLPSSSEIVSHAQDNAPAGPCCAALSFVLGDKVSYPDQQPYKDSLSSYWAAQEQSVSPKCVVEPGSSEDVSSAVFVLSLLGTRTDFRDECKFAIRSGGHTPWAGSANIEGGVTVDLKFLNQVDVSEDRSVTSVGPGNRWVDVYLKLDALGLAVPGGRVSDVGVGGLTLGGGISFFAPRYGFVCDNVLNYEIVLANGIITNANATSHPHLFRALKGGSNNFGVVTRFDLKTLPSGKFWGGAITYPIETREQHFKAFADLASSSPYDEYAALINNFAYAGIAGEWFVETNLEYTKQPAETYPPAFSEFTDIKPQLANTMRVSNLSDFTLEISQGIPPGGRYLFLTLTHTASAPLLSTIFTIANKTLQPLLPSPSLVYALSFQPLPTLITHRGDNVLGLSSSTQTLVITLLTVSWRDAADDAKVNQAATQWLRESEDAARDVGGAVGFKYLNYAARGQDVIGGYGRENVEFLQQVSRRVDAEGVFQKGAVGGFKLFR